MVSQVRLEHKPARYPKITPKDSPSVRDRVMIETDWDRVSPGYVLIEPSAVKESFLINDDKDRKTLRLGLTGSTIAFLEAFDLRP